MTENQDFYTDALQALDVPAALQKETAVETEKLPALVPEKKRRPRWVKLLCCILCAALLVGGGLAVWLEYRPLPDTDPNAPFQDLSDRTKQNVIAALQDYYGVAAVFIWYQDDVNLSNDYAYKYGLRYMGTVGGFHIIMHPIYAVTGISEPSRLKIAGYSFQYPRRIRMYAYRAGRVIRLEDAYNQGLLSDAQILKIYQCYERYNEEVYRRRAK